MRTPRPSHDPFGARTVLETASGDVVIWSLASLERRGIAVSGLPYAVRILLESLLRRAGDGSVSEDEVLRLARSERGGEFGFLPARVVLQDFTGVPCVVDLAAMRDAVADMKGDPARVNPRIPVDLVIDHSVQVDAYGTPGAFAENVRREFGRNAERYAFLKWGQKAFKNLRVVPPATGIVHQVNLERLATVVTTVDEGGERIAYPDSLVGTDSHTTMINGLGVLGWGVGGIEAEAAMLGQPIALSAPTVVGVRLSGALREGVTATDLVLAVTQTLRAHGVVEKFVEFYGPGADALPLADRATIANMAPEYGATVGYFPIDDETLRYLRLTGRDEKLVDLVERYAKAQGLFRSPGSAVPSYDETLEIDLAAIEPSIAGPKRPQDRVPLAGAKASFLEALAAPAPKGYGVASDGATFPVEVGGRKSDLRHGSVVIAAITSCTNTSNPSVMLAAGLLAKKAVDRGLSVPAHVKTSMAPGSRAVRGYLEKAGLLAPLERLGFGIVGYGCTTCIGNSGPVDASVSDAVERGNLTVAAVLSGNRNFEGRVHPVVKANYLASPPLVVAYALAGRMDVDLATEPLGLDASGVPVFLRDLWPAGREVAEAVAGAVSPGLFRAEYADLLDGGPEWAAVSTPEGERYRWDADSTYVRNPPFFEGLAGAGPAVPEDIADARVLVMVGDSVTTDHISPAGNISSKGAAAAYLVEHGVAPADFNSYGARRGNHEVMMRGTFGNTRLKNLLAPGTEGGVTRHLPSGAAMSVYDAAMRYAADGVPLVVIAGKDYGMGSSRDWAAKGVRLLGVKAVLFESVERIHRSNLVGMGVLPLQFKDGETPRSLGLDGEETFAVEGLAAVAPGKDLAVTVRRRDGTSTRFFMRCRLDTPIEVEYWKNGGILPFVLRSMAAERQPA